MSIKIGIYRILCTVTGNCYVGSSANINKRFGSHMTNLRCNRHNARYMQRSWNKYGEESFRFEILEEGIQKDCLISKEKEYCRKFAIEGKFLPAFNTIEPGDVSYGKRHTLEFRKKLSKLYTGRKLTEQHKANVSAGLLRAGRTISKENIAKMQNGRLEKPLSAESRKKMSDAHKGVKLSQSHKDSIKRSQINNPSRKWRPVIGKSVKTGEIKKYASIKAVKEDGFHAGHVGGVCRGVNRTHKGFYWKYAEDVQGK